MRSRTGSLWTVVCLVFTAAASADAADVRYEKFESKEQLFSVLLPMQPRTKTDDLGDGFVEHTFFSPFSQELQFTVKCLEVPHRTVVGKDPQELMIAFRRGWRTGKTIVDDKELSVGPTKIPAREYRLDAEPGYVLRERMLLAGTRIYILYIVTKDEAFLDSEVADRFFDSFEVSTGGG